MHTYFMTTERLGFGTWTRDDFDLAYSLWSNPEVTRYIGGPFSREKVEARLEREIENQRTRGIQYWPLFVRESGEFAGCCGLRPHNDIIALGFHLLPPFWGRGYAREAGRAVIDYATNTLHATKIYAGHHPQNLRSKAALEALGFEYVSDDFYEPTGLMHPSYLLG